jgi:hypothetical protein
MYIPAYKALEKFCKLDIDGEVLDIGSGLGLQANIMRNSGLNVVTLDKVLPADIQSGWPTLLGRYYDAIWCSHTLEHSFNPGEFLEGIYTHLEVGGWLAITVPPAKPNIVGGHVTMWNAGLLLYNLILAGFDCSDAQVLTYEYNVSVILQKKIAILPELKYDNGDIEILAQFFPFDAKQSFNGDIQQYNWK